MKQIITFLLVILVSILANGQDVGKNKRESKNLKTTKFYKRLHTQNNRFNDFKTRGSLVKRKAELLKSNFSENKYLDSLINQEWDEDFNEWRLSSKEEFSYGNDDYISLSMLYLWDSNTSSWEVFQQKAYTFDSNGNLSSQITSYQFMPNVWVLNNKTEYTYNSSGNLELESDFSWDSMNSQWINTYKHQLTYDSSQNIILDVGYEWFIGINDWVYNYKDEFFYTNGVVSSEISSYWNHGSNQWYLFSKWEYFNDNVGLYLEILYRRDLNNTAWVYESKYEYQYEFGTTSVLVLTNETGYTWDISMNQWESQYKDEYVYDSNDNRTIGIYFEWNETPGEWIQYYKDEYVFDLAYNLGDIIAPYFYDDAVDDTFISINNMLIGYLGFEYVDQAWVDTDKILLFYSNYTNLLEVNNYIQASSLKVFPNPTGDKLRITSEIPLEKVEIYSILGHKVKEFYSNFDNLPVYDIAAGLYVVNIESKNNIVKKKIIKQ